MGRRASRSRLKRRRWCLSSKGMNRSLKASLRTPSTLLEHGRPSSSSRLRRYENRYISNIESEGLVSETNKRLVKLHPTMVMSVTDNAPESGSNEQAQGAGVTRHELISGDRAWAVRDGAVRESHCNMC